MMTSIIMLTCNKLEYTIKAVESIRKYTDKGTYEIIVIDNASTDNTVEWLKKQDDLKLILNKENLGFPKGCNQGIEVATGTEILLLNNDVIVTPKWLQNMVKTLYSNDKYGAVGPVTNSAPGQEIAISYKEEEEINDFANEVFRKFKNKITKKIKLVGFCLLIRKKILDKIGVLDEIFSPGNYEDDDLSIRILLEGYDLILCESVFIHHFGSVSFKKKVVAFNTLLNKNKEKFNEKWSLDLEYVGICRRDIIEFMNLASEKLNILEIGCGVGSTLLEIKNINPSAILYGIEKNKQAALVAGNFAEILTGDVENFVFPYPENFFDYIIFGDVLEHLYNPQKVLENIKPYLKEDGKIIASIPNIQHWSIIEELLKGNWSYTDAGILDKTHLRFFTRNEITKLFNNSGYEVKQFVGKDIGLTETAKNMLEKLLQNGLIESFDDFIAYQWLVEATKNEREEDKKELVYLLRRIDNDINIDENINEVKSFIREKKIEHKIIVELINISLIKKVKVLLSIVISMYNNQEQESAIKILIEGYKLYNDNVEVVCTLAYLLNVKGERESAIKILENCSLEDENIEKLLHEIRGVQ